MTPRIAHLPGDIERPVRRLRHPRRTLSSEQIPRARRVSGNLACQGVAADTRTKGTKGVPEVVAIIGPSGPEGALATHRSKARRALSPRGSSKSVSASLRVHHMAASRAAATAAPIRRGRIFSDRSTVSPHRLAVARPCVSAERRARTNARPASPIARRSARASAATDLTVSMRAVVVGEQVPEYCRSLAQRSRVRRRACRGAPKRRLGGSQA
jgi:hypothetical protein